MWTDRDDEAIHAQPGIGGYPAYPLHPTSPHEAISLL